MSTAPNLLAEARTMLPTFTDAVQGWVRWDMANPNASGHRDMSTTRVGPWRLLSVERQRDAAAAMTWLVVFVEIEGVRLAQRVSLESDSACVAEAIGREVASGLARWLDEAEARLAEAAEPPDWRPAESLPEDHYAAGGGR
jgi:hypothetical protein